MRKDYVLLAIDSGKHENTAGLLQRLQPEGITGIPWMVILDGDGELVVSSKGPKGNIGCPWQPDEIVYFRTMLETSRKTLTDAELDAIVAANRAFRVEVEKRPKPKK